METTTKDTHVDLMDTNIPVMPAVDTANNLGAEADDYNGDVDSTLGVDDNGSSTASVNSSIRAYRQENGRTYHSHKDGSYMMPNDDEENDRLDLQHELFSRTLHGALITAKIPETQVLHRVLDIGTGTGIWAIDFADEHPESQVLGVDLSPIQPQFVPSNCRFEVDDVEAPWVYSNKWDLIHSRMMTGSIADWPKLIGQALENLNPGGWIQLTDIVPLIMCDDGSLPPTSALIQWGECCQDAFRKIGKPGDSARRYKAQLEAAGFVDVVEIHDKWPINTFPRDRHYKTLGMWNYQNITDGMMGLSLALFTRVLGWSVQELEILLVDVRKEMKNTRIHGYYEVNFVSGRKPE